MEDSGWIVGFHAVLALLKADRPVDAVWVQNDRKDQRSRQIVAALGAVDRRPRGRGTVPYPDPVLGLDRWNQILIQGAGS